jgi:hypothetical protein
MAAAGSPVGLSATYQYPAAAAAPRTAKNSTIPTTLNRRGGCESSVAGGGGPAP